MTFAAGSLPPAARLLVAELVEAHVDTIELLLDRKPDVDDAPHVDYLQALVRRAKAMTAGHIDDLSPSLTCPHGVHRAHRRASGE
jgi:hypothetical protein